MRSQVEIGDKVFITTNGEVEEATVVGRMFNSRFRLQSANGEITAKLNENMFLSQVAATQSLIDQFTGVTPETVSTSNSPNVTTRKSYDVCEYCGSVLTTAEEKCGCKYGRR